MNGLAFFLKEQGAVKEALPQNCTAAQLLIARMGKAPLIPLGLENVSKVKQKGQRVRFPRITARFGTPVELSSFDFLPKDERMDGCSWYVMREAYALRGVASQRK